MKSFYIIFVALALVSLPLSLLAVSKYLHSDGANRFALWAFVILFPVCINSAIWLAIIACFGGL